jgi:transcriptional regulator with XRE-family HTH domain
MAKKEPISARLKRLREARLLSVAELAAETGVSEPTLYRLEASGGTPRMSTLAALSQFFHVTIGQVRGTEPLKGEK